MRAKPAALIIALAAMLPLLTGSDLRSRESSHYPSGFACHDRDFPMASDDCGVSGKTVAVIGLGIGLLGYVFGRASAPSPQDPAKVTTEVDGVFKDRIEEAARHNSGEAVPLLEKAHKDVLGALRKLGVAS